MTTLPSSSACRIRCVEMFLMRALVWKLSVTMPTWAPVKLSAFSPRLWIAIAISAIEICSPVASSMSISRAGGRSLISLANSINSSVVPPNFWTTRGTATGSWHDGERDLGALTASYWPGGELPQSSLLWRHALGVARRGRHLRHLQLGVRWLRLARTTAHAARQRRQQD